MTTPCSGTISLLDVRTELGDTGSTSLNEASVRSLAGVPSGTITLSDLHCKSVIDPCDYAYDNTKWSPINGVTWNGTTWVLPGQSPVSLTPISGWETGFRPTSVDITYTQVALGMYLDSWDFTFRDTNNNTLGTVNANGNGAGTHTETVNLTFSIYDIGSFRIDSYAYNSATIDAICFNA